MENVQTYLFMLDLIFPVNKGTKILEVEPNRKEWTFHFLPEKSTYHRFDFPDAAIIPESEDIELEDRHHLFAGLYRIGFSLRANTVVYSKIV